MSNDSEKSKIKKKPKQTKVSRRHKLGVYFLSYYKGINKSRKFGYLQTLQISLKAKHSNISLLVYRKYVFL